MNHNSAAMLAIDPRRGQRFRLPEDAQPQRLLFRPTARAASRSATCSCSARSTATSSRSSVGCAPKFALDYMARHAVDWYLMCEDLPDPESRIMVDGAGIVHAVAAHQHAVADRPGQGDARKSAGLRLSDRAVAALRQAHAVASMRHGAHGQRPRRPRRSTPGAGPSTTSNLFVVDGGFLPTSAAVNPALIDRRAGAARRRPHPQDGSRGMSRPVAIVTGASRGIGLAIAESLADAGFDICVADLAGWEPTRPRSRRSCAISAPTCCSMPVRHQRSRRPRAAGRGCRSNAFGQIDCLVNNAGIASPVRGDLLDLQPANFDKVMSVNLRGTVFLTQAVGQGDACQARRASRASIVNITSVSAEMASPERADYCVSKAGLSMWTKDAGAAAGRRRHRRSSR